MKPAADAIVLKLLIAADDAKIMTQCANCHRSSIQFQPRLLKRITHAKCSGRHIQRVLTHRCVCMMFLRKCLAKQL